MRNTDAETSGEIARELLADYMTQRIRSEKIYRDEQISRLKAAINEQESEIDGLSKELAQIDLTIRKNIRYGGSETLLHIPDPPERAEARRKLANAKSILSMMKLKLMEEENNPIDSRVKIVEPVMIKRISCGVFFYSILGTIIGFVISLVLSVPKILQYRRVESAAELPAFH